MNTTDKRSTQRQDTLAILGTYAPGSIRAGKEIANMFRGKVKRRYEKQLVPTTEALIAIIDRETAAADLLNGLEDAVEDIKQLCKELDDRGANVQDIEEISVGFYEGTIAKAKGEKC